MIHPNVIIASGSPVVEPTVEKLEESELLVIKNFSEVRD